MSYFVYILYSGKCDRYYIGYASNPALRLAERHNQGKVRSTRSCYPYQLVKYKEFPTEKEAIHEERKIKKQKSRKYIESLIKGNW